MSIRRARKIGRLAGIAAAACLLAGCGFRPFYGAREFSPAATALAAIRINAPSGRLDQILRNELIERLTPFGEPAKPSYALAIETNKTNRALAIQSDGRITRYDLRVTARFSLDERRGGTPLYRGNAHAVSSYDVVRSSFSNLTAEQDAVRRTVRMIAEDIHFQLGAFFSRSRETAQ